MRKRVKEYKKWFNSYVTETIENSSRESLNFELKKEHTYRVMDNMNALADIMDLDTRGRCLCEIIGLFHDLGRFRQYDHYGTFKDDVTGSHGTIGVEVLKETNLLKELTEQEKEIVYKAIEYHNHLLVPVGESEEITMYANLIRDADKLDAYYLHTLENGKMYKLEDYSNEKPYSQEIVDAIMGSQQADFRDIKYTHDLNLAIVALLFNINLKESMEVIRRESYMERMFKLFPNDLTMQAALEHCNNYISSQLR